jgi:hypothetical protein
MRNIFPNYVCFSKIPKFNILNHLIHKNHYLVCAELQTSSALLIYHNSFQDFFSSNFKSHTKLNAETLLETEKPFSP